MEQRLCLQLKAVLQMPSKGSVNTRHLVFAVEEPERSVIFLTYTFFPALTSILLEYRLSPCILDYSY